MKTLIKTFCAAMVALVTVTALAVEPIAVWSGDFNEPEKGGLTLNLNGNTCSADNSYIEITGNNGVMVSGGNVNHSTVLIKYSNLDWSNAGSGKVISLLTHKCGAKTEANCTGIAVASDGALHGIWINNKWSNTTGGPLVAPSDASAKVSLACTFVSAAAAGDEGTRAFYKDEDGVVTQVYNASGLRGTKDNTVTTDWSIGGHYGTSTGSNVKTSATGMKIYGIAIFDKWLTQAEVAAYEFPEPGNVLISIDNDDGSGVLEGIGNYRPDAILIPESYGLPEGTSILVTSVTFAIDSTGAAKADWMSINGTQSSGMTVSGTWPNTSYPLVTYDFGEGVPIVVGTSAPMGASGDSRLRLFANVTDPDRSYIGVTEASTMSRNFRPAYIIKGILSKETYTGKVISVNVTQGSTGYINADQTTPLGTFPASAWTQQSSEARGAGNAQKIDFSTVAEYNVNTATKTDVSAKVFGIARDAGNFGRRDVAGDIAPATGYDYLYCWMSMKDGTQGTTYLNAEVPYETYDVYLYFSAHKVAQKSGGAAPAIRSFVIGGTHSSIDAEPTGGTRYTVDASGALVVSSDANATWGDGSIADVQVGKNYVVLENQSGAFSLLMNGSSGGLAAVQFAERNSGKKKVEVDCGTEYSMSDANAVEGDAITLKFADAGGTLLVDEAPSRKYTIKCAGKMEILGDDYTMTQTDFNKLTLTQVAGSLTIDAKGGLEMTDAIKSAIRAATSNKTYTFIGEGNKGVALDYGDNNDGTQLKTHIVFDGGAHTMKYRCENAGLKFGANATADNPTIRVTNNATLTFAARNLCGWTSGNSNADGIIRVDNGSKLYLNPTGGTLYWAQQFYLEPGAQLTYSDGASFRINGGTSYAPQIFVPDSAVDMTDTPAKIIRSGNNDFCVNGQGTKGMAISVGANSKLVIESGIALNDANCDVVKLGGGVLEVTGNIVNQNFIVNDGSVSLLGSITKLTFGENGALDISEGTPTITGSLVTATEKQLELTVDSPVHMMPVITLPAGADKTGWTAIVNGKSSVNDLIAEGNTLKLKWKIPPTIELDEDSIVIEPASDWNGGKVMVDISTLNRGDYTGEDDIKYILRFGDKTVFGEEKDDKANFELDPAEFTAGNIYRGEFVVGYGEDGDEVPGAEVTLYMGEKGYKEAVDWVNETVDTFKTTGSYDPDEGAKIEDDKLAFNSAGDVVFTPNEHADYVERCDSVFTFEILAEEAIDDDDDSIEDDVQAGVKLVANNKGGVKFQFISGDEWIDGPDASLNTMYEVKVSFHYAKEDGDSDTVTYEVKDLTQGALVVERREGTDEKASEIVFSDGTKLGYLKGTLQVEAATPKERGMEPGGKEMPLKADNQKDADEEAKKIPVLVPNDENVVAALDTDAKKDVYKALFKVVAVKKDGAYVAQVVFTDTAISTIKEDEKNILSEVMEKLGSLLGEEGELDDIKGQPGLYYGIGSDGELVNMGEAQPEEWKIADKDGNIIGLKVKKAANAKRGFYKVLCSPVKSSSK